jgi:ParB family chromosome partitioning protein
MAMTNSAAAENHPEKEKVEKRRALGRGLASLLPGPRVVEPKAVAAEAPITIQAVVEEVPASPSFAKDGPPAGETEVITISAQADTRVPANLVMNIELDAIEKNPYQTRYEFDEEALEELANSIRANGVVQPVLVRPAEEEGRYVLILGERRCRASKLAGKTTVPAMVKRVSQQQAAEMTIIENLQREDLNCIEQAEAFRVLSQEFGLSQTQIGEKVGMSRVSIANYMRLLKMTQSTMEHVIAGRISFTEARELLKLEDPITIEIAADRAVREQMKFEQVETMVIKMLGMLEIPGQETMKKGAARWVDPNVKAAQLELERLLGVRVRIRDKKGRGKIVIEYHTVDDYERVLGALKGR